MRLSLRSLSKPFAAFSPPTVRSFPTLPLQTEVIGIADNHCCGMPPRRLSHSNPDVCVCTCERGDHLWNQRGGDRENQRGEEADENVPRHHTVSSRNHEGVCFGRVSPYFTFCFWEKLKTFGFGGEGCLKTCVFPFLAGLLADHPSKLLPAENKVSHQKIPKRRRNKQSVKEILSKCSAITEVWEWTEYKEGTTKQTKAGSKQILLLSHSGGCTQI